MTSSKAIAPSIRIGMARGCDGSSIGSVAWISSTMRSVAPAARCSSPRISESAATEPATITE